MNNFGKEIIHKISERMIPDCDVTVWEWLEHLMGVIINQLTSNCLIIEQFCRKT